MRRWTALHDALRRLEAADAGGAPAGLADRLSASSHRAERLIGRLMVDRLDQMVARQAGIDLLEFPYPARCLPELKSWMADTPGLLGEAFAALPAEAGSLLEDLYHIGAATTYNDFETPRLQAEHLTKRTEMLVRLGRVSPRELATAARATWEVGQRGDHRTIANFHAALFELVSAEPAIGPSLADLRAWQASEE